MDDSPHYGWILYDDSCGFCRAWIPFWETTLRRNGFAIAALQEDWARQRLGVSDAELLEDLRLLLIDGRQVRGADVYRHVMRQIWWAWPIYFLSILPLSRLAFNWGYRTFARNRFLVSNVCRLPGKRANGLK